MHAAGIAHGDVKSSNVLLDADGLAHLADFGSAQRVGARGPRRRLALRDESGAPCRRTGLGGRRRLRRGRAALRTDQWTSAVLSGSHAARVREETAGRRCTGRPHAARDLVQRWSAQCLAKRPGRASGLAAGDPRPARGGAERCSAGVTRTPRRRQRLAAAAGRTARPPAMAAHDHRRAVRGNSRAPRRFSPRVAGERAIAGASRPSASHFLYCPIWCRSARRRPQAAPAATAARHRPRACRPATHRTWSNWPSCSVAPRNCARHLPERIAKLEQTDAARWGTAALAPAQKPGWRRAMRAWTSREFAAAIAHFDAVGDDARRNSKSNGRQVLQELLREASRRFRCGSIRRRRRAVSRPHCASTPNNEAARTGLARAKVLDEVLRETALGARAEQQGDAAMRPAAYKRALALGSGGAGRARRTGPPAGAGHRRCVRGGHGTGARRACAPGFSDGRGRVSARRQDPAGNHRGRRRLAADSARDAKHRDWRRSCSRSLRPNARSAGPTPWRPIGRH